eukprot:TRINITY_DN7961_c0_g1_i3.p1 TRINITY_DN7961_c0_g1~~TRINITY_DN7961_c0_g1_i3.p1  ORF type:complete len:172 (-),score=39.82 TRINITY_DN7961_c0_g1_i3:258-773(-)
MDFLREKVQTPYAYSWEIYVGESLRDKFIMAAHQRAQETDEASDAEDGDKRQQLPAKASTAAAALVESGPANPQIQPKRLQAAFLERDTAKAIVQDCDLAKEEQKDTVAKRSAQEECMEQFNPPTQEETEKVVKNWSQAFLELCDRVLSHSDSHIQSKAAPKRAKSLRQKP